MEGSYGRRKKKRIRKKGTTLNGSPRETDTQKVCYGNPSRYEIQGIFIRFWVKRVEEEEEEEKNALLLCLLELKVFLTIQEKR